MVLKKPRTKVQGFFLNCRRGSEDRMDLVAIDRVASRDLLQLRAHSRLGAGLETRGFVGAPSCLCATGWMGMSILGVFLSDVHAIAFRMVEG